ncbi:hypothetical protein CkaCkLH20_05243 [Colletotrichum karsti]|uniref:Uncharacterized protein n=1 Tax=Colletotrichum karsti TaxID=1095194 RepID=A0A9P6LLA4_9PEZI|nr:uncharacterized protein CkaCkLH20_05243 [Colletotrichum karsti]KAF9877543.1 hypothetical protein CkaCkLH20_05243 [Colletotrichum karsti]
MAKNRPGQGARRRQRNREQRDKEAYLTGNHVPESAIPRSKRIIAKKKQRKQINERLDGISKEIKAMEEQQQNLLEEQQRQKDKAAASTFKTDVRNNRFNVVRDGLENTTNKLNAHVKTFNKMEEDMGMRMDQSTMANAKIAKMEHQMEAMMAEISALREARK